MPKLNSFQKGALILLAFMFLQVIFTFIFPFRAIPEGETVEISRNVLVFTATTAETSHTYVPVLTVLFVLVLLALLAKKEKPLTLIYGLGLMLLTKVNFLTQLNQLSGSQENFSAGGFLTTRIYAEGALAAQDITFFVIAVLFLIKAAIVTYHGVKKRIDRKQKHLKENNI